MDNTKKNGWFGNDEFFKTFYVNGKRHCEDGPAVVCGSGARHWFLNDKKVSWQEVYRNAKTAEQQVNILIHASADPSNLDDIIALTTP
jgi:hypothetical protein